MFQISICAKCLHKKIGPFCNAFPNGIPDIILNGDNNHKSPIPKQQNNIVFEPKLLKSKG
jgi:hypothetical protein